MILLYALQQLENSFPGYKCETYASIKSACRKWRSSWLILIPRKHSWHTTDRIFWKTKVCQPKQSSSQVMPSWLKNELYELTEAVREILKSKDGWLNDNLMDARQQLICKAVGSLETYQSVLNCQIRSQYTSQFLATIFSYCTMVVVTGY